jgi:uncharacterized membrane protein
MPEDPLKRDEKASLWERTVLRTYLVTSLVYPLWLAGIWLAPYLRSRASRWSSLVYALYTPVCHQVADRSFFCYGQPLSVCARCSGIYLGFFLGLALFPWLRKKGRLSLPSARAFLLVSAPIVLDTAANFLRLWPTPGVVRLVTGLLWGAILPFYFIPGLVDLFMTRRKNRLKSPPASS